MNIEKYIGIPYRSRGREKSLDCWGLVMLFYKNEMGVNLSSLGGYENSENGEQVNRVINQESAANWNKVGTPKAGDVVVFRMGRHISHVGVALEGGKFLHSIKNRQTCVERLNNAIWKDRIYGFFRLRELA